MKILISSLQDSFLCIVQVLSFFIGSFIIYFAFTTYHSNWFFLFSIIFYLISLFCFMCLHSKVFPGNYQDKKNFKKD
jgi:VIT1/CCC1 family predicted Fe2+/Mn2+ transporter